MNPELKRAAELAAEYIESFDHQKVSEELDPAALRDKLQKELTAEGLPPLQVINELDRDARDGLLNTGGGRFFGWVIGGGIPVSIAADWLTSAWDQNAAAYAATGQDAKALESGSLSARDSEGGGGVRLKGLFASRSRQERYHENAGSRLHGRSGFGGHG